MAELEKMESLVEHIVNSSDEESAELIMRRITRIHRLRDDVVSCHRELCVRLHGVDGTSVRFYLFLCCYNATKMLCYRGPIHLYAYAIIFVVVAVIYY